MRAGAQRSRGGTDPIADRACAGGLVHGARSGLGEASGSARCPEVAPPSPGRLAGAAILLIYVTKQACLRFSSNG